MQHMRVGIEVLIWPLGVTTQTDSKQDGVTNTALWPFVSERIFSGSTCSPLAFHHLSLANNSTSRYGAMLPIVVAANRCAEYQQNHHDGSPQCIIIHQHW